MMLSVSRELGLANPQLPLRPVDPTGLSAAETPLIRPRLKSRFSEDSAVSADDLADLCCCLGARDVHTAQTCDFELLLLGC